jgi:hypothetical protein
MQNDQVKEGESPLAGLANPRALALERFPICTRESSSTLSAWRLTIMTDEGDGSIYLVGISPDRALYRGDGLFLGWSQQRLEAVYRELRPVSEEPPFDSLQLG